MKKDIVRFEVDVFGFLEYKYDWTPEFAEMMAKKDSVDLTPDHWVVIHYLRDCYDVDQIIPSHRILCKEMGKKLSRKHHISEYISQLFPGRTYQQAYRYAGCPYINGQT